MNTLSLILFGCSVIGLFAHSPDDELEIVNVRKRRSSLSDLDCAEGKLTRQQQLIFLNIHNQAREQLAAGKSANKSGLLPSGRNIYKLQWSCDLAEQAQEWAEQCQDLAADQVLEQGQVYSIVNNVAAGANPNKYIVSALQGWWNQAQNEGVPDDLSYNIGRNIQAWANMANAATSQVGCAISTCLPNSLAITCIYDKAGDVPGKQIYEDGKPCVIDSDCSTHPGSHCIPGDGVCYVHPEELADSYEAEKSRSKACPHNPRMTDAARSTVVDWHNGLRSRVARGLEPDAQGGFAPTAKGMLRMHYDCSLERSAQLVANSCKYGETRRGKKIGENMFQTTTSGAHDQETLLQLAHAKWWSDLKEVGVGQNLTFNAACIMNHVTAYTQMAWSDTFRVGCATNTCGPEQYFVVCHYSPHGNRPQNQIYSVGRPCLKDDECDRGQSCSIEDGLCSITLD